MILFENKDVYYLEDNEEMVGKLSSFESEDQNLLLHFTINYNIAIKKEDIIKIQLEKLQGKNIALLRLDNKYYVKEKNGGSDR